MDWVCSGCGRHFSWAVSECPYCKFETTITTGGTQPTDTQQTKVDISEFRNTLQWCYNYANKQSNSDEKTALLDCLKRKGCVKIQRNINRL